jgi:cytochrome c-type biogenesis protein CcmH
MSDVGSTARRYPSAAALALAAAGLIAVASAGVAIFRSADEPSPPTAAHGSVKPEQPVGDVRTMIAGLEARLRQDPDNPADWRMLGWSYFETGDLMRAAAAYRRAAEVEPEKAENWSSLGEALQTASAEVSPEAAGAFERALRLDPKDPRARYFLGVQKDLKGQHEAAVSDWIALLEDTPAGAPWEADLRRTIQQVADKAKIDLTGRMPQPGSSIATAAIPGPTREQMAAAASIPPGQQSEMVRGMVEGLAARLRQNPKDAPGWIRLMRARMVLGETDAARAAHHSALAAFAGDSPTTAQLNQAARELGIPGAG